MWFTNDFQSYDFWVIHDLTKKLFSCVWGHISARTHSSSFFPKFGLSPISHSKNMGRFRIECGCHTRRKVKLCSVAVWLPHWISVWQCGKYGEIVWQCANICHTATVPHYFCHTLECGTVALWQCGRCCKVYWRVRVYAILPDICRTICRTQFLGFFFENYINDFSETWNVTISDNTPSPLQVSVNFLEWFFHTMKYWVKNSCHFAVFTTKTATTEVT